MPLTWEAITALASLMSSLAILAALVVAVRQVRVGAQQVEHLRRATQLEGTMKIFAMLSSPEQQEARRFILRELSARMKDPSFRAELADLTMTPNRAAHKELDVLRLMEMIGTYVKHGLLDEEIVFDYWAPMVRLNWEALDQAGIVAAHREATVPEMWENFEDLYVRAKRWVSEPPRRPAQRAPARSPVESEVVAGASGP